MTSIIQELPYDFSPPKIRCNIQGTCHICMIYITLSVDTYIDTFARVWWAGRTIKGKLP